MTTTDRDVIDLYADKMAREAEEIADYETMLGLLSGYRVSNGRQLPAKYPQKGSWEERRARSALARYVNRMMPGFVGHLLALAIDPDMQPNPGTKRTRSIKFESPRRGKNIEWARHLDIVADVHRALREESANVKLGERLVLDSALEKVRMVHNVSREAAYKIWMAHPLGQSWADYFQSKTK